MIKARMSDGTYLFGIDANNVDDQTVPWDRVVELLNSTRSSSEALERSVVDRALMDARNTGLEEAAQRVHQHRLRMNELGNRMAGDAAAFLENAIRELKSDPPECTDTNTPQAGAMTATSFEGLKRASSLDQPHPRNPSQVEASGPERVAESSGDLRVAGASPLSASTAQEMAEQWMNRGDDAGRLARAVLSAGGDSALRTAAADLLNFMGKVVGYDDAAQVEIKATDIGAAGMQQRLNALQTALSATTDIKEKT